MTTDPTHLPVRVEDRPGGPVVVVGDGGQGPWPLTVSVESPPETRVSEDRDSIVHALRQPRVPEGMTAERLRHVAARLEEDGCTESAHWVTRWVVGIAGAEPSAEEPEQTEPEPPTWVAATGFAGYHGCPATPCTGRLASLCAAAGDCAALALLDRSNGAKPEPAPEPRTERVPWWEALGRRVPDGTTIDSVGSNGLHPHGAIASSLDDGFLVHADADGTVEVLVEPESHG